MDRETLYDLVEEKVHDIFLEYQLQNGIDGRDITTIQESQLEEIQNKLTDLIMKVGVRKDVKYNYTEISKEEAKELYRNSNDIYICNNRRKYWRLPASSEYSSHAPITELFERSVPKYEGNTSFYIQFKRV